MRTRFCIWMFVLFLTVVTAMAPQRARSASVYSMVLLGERLEAGDVRSITLGSSANLVMDTLSVMHYNQAMLAHLGRFTIGVSQFLGLDETRTEELAEQDNSFAVTTLQAAFPIQDYFVLSVGYRGRYDPDGSFSLRGKAPSGESFTQQFSKTGGLFSIPITIATRFTRFLSVAATLSVERGFIQDQWATTFDNAAFNEAVSSKREELSGVGYGAAVILHPTRGLMIGGTFESEIDYDGDVRIRFTQPGLDTTYASSVKLPARFTGAASLSVRGWMLLASGFYSNMEAFSGLSFDETRLRNEWDASLGIEWSDGVPIFGKRLPLRVSVNIGQLPFEHLNGSVIDKTIFGFGTGFPLRDGKGKLDVGFQAGTIGSVESNGLEDRIFRIYIGVAGGEEWKRKRGANP